MDKNTFFAKLNGKDVQFLVKDPNLTDMSEAQKVRNRIFADAVTSKALLRAKLDDVLKEQGLWNDAKQAELTSLQQELVDGEKKLAQGGIHITQAKKIALNMRRVRLEMQELLSVRNNLDNNTAEGQADNARFNYLVSACLVYKDTGKPYFKDMAEYLNRSTENVAIRGAEILASMMYGLESDYESKLPENTFLKDFKFVDDELRLVNKDGKLVDPDGRLIDEFGRFIDEDGNYVDIDGNPLNEDGGYAFERKPFLDDDNNPIILDEEPKAKRKKTTKKSEAVVSG